MADRELTDKQRAFCHEYIIDFNGKQAAIRAGYAKGSAEVTASKLLRNAKVSAYLQECIDRRAERTEITADRVLQEFGRIGFSDVRNYFDADGVPIPIHELDNDSAAALVSAKVLSRRHIDDEDGEPSTILATIEIKLADKLKALHDIGQHLGMFKQEIELTHRSFAERMAELERAGFKR